jgi:replicative DNA helicase
MADGTALASIVDATFTVAPQPDDANPLYDHRAEAACIAAVMLDDDGSRGAWQTLSLMLSPAHFHEPRHATLWAALAAIKGRGAAVDVLTIAAELKARGKFTRDTPQFVGEVTDEVITPAHCEDHAKIVRECHARRVIADIGARLTRAATDPTKAPLALRDLAVEALRRVDIGGAQKPADAITLVSEMWEVFENVRTGKGPGALRFNVPTLDRMSGGGVPDAGGMKRGGAYFIAARPGVGKAQPLNAQVLTPRGFVTMGSLRVGDVVTGSDGKPCRVTGVYPQGVKPVFRVTMNDGASTECCDEHLWLTQTRRERIRGIAGSAKQLADVRKTLKIERGTRTNHHIPTVAPVEFDGGSDPLPMAPYLLGLLLGDGALTSGCLLFTNTEDDVRARFCAMLPAEDATSEADEITLRVKRGQRNNELSETMKSIAALGLRGVDCYGKFIPPAYLNASVADRLELLRGLLDTDGYVIVSGRSVEFSTSAERVAADVIYLVRSLGGIVTDAPHVPTFTVNGERRTSSAVAHRMVIRFPNGLVPVSSAKHLARWRQEPTRSMGRCIDTIEPVGEKECQCIAVDAPDHLYVTDGFIVTHNTSLAAQITGATAEAGERVLYVALEPKRVEIMQAIHANRAGVSLTKITRTPWALLQEDIDALTIVSNAVAQWPVHVIDAQSDNPPDTVAKVEAAMRALPSPPALVVVDHLLKLSPVGRHEKEHYGTAQVVAGLVSLGKRTGATILTLCHIGRAMSTTSGLFRRPRAEDIAGGDAMNRDADGIIVLHREDKYPTKKENVGDPLLAGHIDLFAPKLRGVEDNTFGRMRFRGDVQRFEEFVTTPNAPELDSAGFPVDLT